MTINAVLQNTDFGDLFVSVQDLNAAGEPYVLENARLNKDAQQTIQVQEDGDGLYNIKWTAVRVSDNSKTATRTVSGKQRDPLTQDVTTQFD